MQQSTWDIERRTDGAVLVRVHSCNREGQPLPDAVFAFRLGDPQYTYWAQQLNQQDAAQTPSSARKSQGPVPTREPGLVANHRDQR